MSRGSNPPINRASQGRVLLTTIAQASAIGTMPIIIASAVMMTGRNLVKPAERAACTAFMPNSICSLARRRQEWNWLWPRDAHDGAGERGTLMWVLVRKSIQTMPASAPGRRR